MLIRRTISLLFSLTSVVIPCLRWICPCVRLWSVPDQYTLYQTIPNKNNLSSPDSDRISYRVIHIVYQPSKMMIPNAETLCSCPMYQYKSIAVTNTTPVVVLMLILIQYNLQSSTHLAAHILLRWCHFASLGVMGAYQIIYNSSRRILRVCH